MTYKIIWSLSTCEKDCTDCIDSCTNNVLEKREDGLLHMKPYNNCTRCETCYGVCDHGAITIQFVDDTYNVDMIEYVI